MDYQAIHTAAALAAKEAARRENHALPPEQSRGLDCGFGWVELRPSTHAFVRYLKSAKVGDKHWKSGWQIWGSRLHDESTQSISVHLAAARAYVESVGAHNLPGLTVIPGSRYD